MKQEQDVQTGRGQVTVSEWSDKRVSPILECVNSRLSAQLCV
jgi:hypothetical protein